MKEGGEEGDDASWTGESDTLRAGLGSSMEVGINIETGPSDLESSPGGAP